MNKKPNSGSFSSTNQPKKKRGKLNKTHLLEAMESQGLTQVDIWKHTLNLALKEDDSAALSLIVNRLFPAIKPSAELIPEGLLPDDWFDLSRSSRLNYLIMLTVAGRVPVDTCVSLAKVLESAAAVENVDQLDMILDGQVVVGTGDRKSMDRLEFAQNLNERITETIHSDRQRLKGLLAENEMADDSTTESDTTDNTNNTNEETTDE